MTRRTDHDAEFSFSKTTAGRLLININMRNLMSVRSHLLSISVVLEAAGLSLCKGTIILKLVQTLLEWLLHVLSMLLFLALKRATCLVTASLITMNTDRDSSTKSPVREKDSSVAQFRIRESNIIMLSARHTVQADQTSKTQQCHML